MYNYFMLVGIVTNEIEMKEYGEGKKVVNIELSVSKDYKNANGEYVTEKYRISAWESVAEIVCETLSKGSMALIKGRLQQKFVKLEKGPVINAVDLICEKVISFREKEDFDAIAAELE